MKYTVRSNNGNPGDGALVRNSTLSLGLVGGGVAWFLHLLLSYLVAEFGCLTGLGTVTFLGITAVAWLLIVVAVLTLALAGAAVLLSWWSDRKLTSGEKNEEDEGSKRFSARTGLVTNGFFFFVILVESIPLFYYLHDC